MLSGEEYAYYDDGYNYSGIRMDDVEYVEDADGNVVYTNIWNYEPSGNNDAALKEEYKPDGADSILDIVNNNKDPINLFFPGWKLSRRLLPAK